MNEGDKVKMISFNGKTYSPTPMNPESVYELLIGRTGTIVQDPEERTLYAGFTEEKQVLVRFDNDLDALIGTHKPSNVPNALWIPEKDLRVL